MAFIWCMILWWHVTNYSKVKSILCTGNKNIHALEESRKIKSIVGWRFLHFIHYCDYFIGIACKVTNLKSTKIKISKSYQTNWIGLLVIVPKLQKTNSYTQTEFSLNKTKANWWFLFNRCFVWMYIPSARLINVRGADRSLKETIQHSIVLCIIDYST